MRTLHAVLIALLIAAPAVAVADVADEIREGDRHYEDRNLKKAAAAYDTAIRKWPTRVPEGVYAKRAGIFVELGDLDGALAFLRDKAKKQFPDAPDVLEQEAVVLWGLGKKGDAITSAERAAATKESAWAAQLLIGEFYASRDPDRTAVAYTAYLKYRPADREDKDVLPMIRLGLAYLTKARMALGDGDDNSARDAYLRAEATFDDLKRKHGKRQHTDPNADIGLCSAYTGLGKHDQAITICEQVLRKIRNASDTFAVHFNLGTAYLQKKQYGKARTAAQEFLKVKPKEARGHILIGDAYYAEKDFQRALESYIKAEQLLTAAQQRAANRLAIQMGKTYRQLPFKGTGKNPNLALAIEKLERGLASDPNSRELAIELGSAYLGSGDDGKALSVTDRLINQKDFGTASQKDRVALYQIAAKALYNQQKHKDARVRFEAAHKLDPKDVGIRRGLVQTIQYQSYQAFTKKEYKVAASLLDEAAKVDAGTPGLHLNRAVLAIDQGDCAEAQKHLAKLEGAKGYAMVRERLLARSYLCIAKPNPKKAAEHYAAADKEAKKNQANLMQAEIYTEWAPMSGGGFDDTVSKLQDAVQFSTQAPEIHGAAKRNLAIALFRRGWKLLKDGKSNEASADFERANREPALLKGTEPLAFEFSYALALLDKGDTNEAAKLFKSLAGKGSQDAYLKAPYNKVGTKFFAAYAAYRGGTPDKRAQAAKEFEALATGASGSFAQKIRELLSSSYEYVAYDHWRNGREAKAKSALTSAAKYASGDADRRITHNQAALDLSAKQISKLEKLGSSPPEALVNLGILYDRAGKPKEAYEAWTKAAARGVGHKDLKKWIDAKQRIYGFN
jgi:tetratricopeptide (TPR) repeat protein